MQRSQPVVVLTLYVRAVLDEQVSEIHAPSTLSATEWPHIYPELSRLRRARELEASRLDTFRHCAAVKIMMLCSKRKQPTTTPSQIEP
jgi:hypothetical protein